MLTFESVNHTMMTEKKLKDEGFDIKTIPTPREISKSCGLTIRMDMEDLEKVKEFKGSLPIDYIWRYTMNPDGNIAEKIE
ncbi:DUF3343 domain-containing protein [Lagierella sp.]|uniref:DUF3343 domain-containing protein n=1 Tax=Lagierella sp. TaxID=2849657 RepID=UPI00260CE1BA|nr:DUF3343 domain-containing protein [Lagierella sp.]